MCYRQQWQPLPVAHFQVASGATLLHVQHMHCSTHYCTHTHHTSTVVVAWVAWIGKNTGVVGLCPRVWSNMFLSMRSSMTRSAAAS